MNNHKKGMLKNKLLRYKQIQDCYIEHKTDENTTMLVYRKYIYPKFFISRNTLYTVLNTPVNKLLKQLK